MSTRPAVARWRRRSAGAVPGYEAPSALTARCGQCSVPRCVIRVPRNVYRELLLAWAAKTYNMTGKKPLNLEKSLEQLESLIDELESGDLPLDTAMKKFEEGIKLTRSCQSALKDAEQRVEILLKSAGGDEALEDFDVEGQ